MDIFQSLADPTRRNIISQLRDDSPLSVSQLCVGQNMSRQGVSKHLKILVDSQIIYKQQKGKQSLHALNPQSLKKIADWLKPYEKLWDQRLSRLELFLGETNVK